jgi:hypothetical protein
MSSGASIASPPADFVLGFAEAEARNKCSVAEYRWRSFLNSERYVFGVEAS